MPRGTCQNDEQVIILNRYVLNEAGIIKKEIPQITRTNIAENKLWGALLCQHFFRK